MSFNWSDYQLKSFVVIGLFYGLARWIIYVIKLAETDPRLIKKKPSLTMIQ